MAQMNLSAVFMKVPEGYIGFVEELPGANTQGETLEEARANLNEAVAMVLEANRALSAQSLDGAEVIREALILHAA
jgi:predicted RNase H-like HicB family nuclease